MFFKYQFNGLYLNFRLKNDLKIMLEYKANLEKIIFSKQQEQLNSLYKVFNFLYFLKVLLMLKTLRIYLKNIGCLKCF